MRTYTPGSGKAEDEQGREDNHRDASSLSLCWIVTVEGEVADRGEDQEADDYAMLVSAMCWG